MAEQLDHLTEVSELPDVSLRVVPFSAGLPSSRDLIREAAEGLRNG